MKKETIEKGNQIVKKLNSLVDYIGEIVNGRLINYFNQDWRKDGAGSLHSITIHTAPIAKNNDNRKISLIFNTQENLYSDLGELLSPEAAAAIKYASLSYRDQISAILLQEEKRIQKELDNLKDE
jgi:hypothetical protein